MRTTDNHVVNCSGAPHGTAKCLAKIVISRYSKTMKKAAIQAFYSSSYLESLQLHNRKSFLDAHTLLGR